MNHLWIAVEFGTTVVMGFVVGMYVDGVIDSRPWGAILGFLLGVVSGALSVRQSVIHMTGKYGGSRRGRK